MPGAVPHGTTGTPVALMYCGRLEEALDYAEKGIREEPDYPWIWLQAAKLRSHSGDKAGALEAVAHGLKLEPGDHEFLTLKREIEAGGAAGADGIPLDQSRRRSGASAGKG